jgi:hypothetical protein
VSVIHDFLRRGFEIARKHVRIRYPGPTKASDASLDWFQAEVEFAKECEKYPTSPIRNSVTCYAVVISRDDQVLGISIFVDSSPAMHNEDATTYATPIICESGETIAEAYDKVAAQLRHPQYAWGGRLVESAFGVHRDNAFDDDQIMIKTIGDGRVQDPLLDAADAFHHLEGPRSGRDPSAAAREVRATALEYAAHHLEYTNTPSRGASVECLRIMAGWERE